MSEENNEIHVEQISDNDAIAFEPAESVAVEEAPAVEEKIEYAVAVPHAKAIHMPGVFSF